MIYLFEIKVFQQCFQFQKVLFMASVLLHADNSA